MDSVQAITARRKSLAANQRQRASTLRARLATDESQGRWAEHFGGVVGRAAGRGGAQIGSCGLGSARRDGVGTVFAGICVAASSPVLSASVVTG